MCSEYGDGDYPYYRDKSHNVGNLVSNGYAMYMCVGEQDGSMRARVHTHTPRKYVNFFSSFLNPFINHSLIRTLHTQAHIHTHTHFT